MEKNLTEMESLLLLQDSYLNWLKELGFYLGDRNTQENELHVNLAFRETIDARDQGIDGLIPGRFSIRD
jgi:hypothetical protein